MDVSKFRDGRVLVRNSGTLVSAVPLTRQIQQTTNCWCFSYFSQKTGFEAERKLSPKETICMKCQPLLDWKDKKNIKDIYSFAVNTINIVIEWNENISIFTSAKHEWKLECFHYTRWKFLWYSLKKSKFSFYFNVYTSMCVSEVISNVTKQNMIVMASTLSA